MPFKHPPHQYTIIPTRTPPASLSLVRVLITDAPQKPPAVVAKRLAKLHDRALKLQQAWIDASRPAQPTEDPRPADVRLDRVWGVSRSRVEDWVIIEDEERAERAQGLLELLFPTGLDFTQLPFHEQWAESERRIVMIEQDDLGDELTDLIDARVLKALHDAHAHYGKVLGITEPKQKAPDPARVGEALKALREEMAGYARLVTGLVEIDDDEGIAAVEAQLGAIIRYRKPRQSAAAEQEDVEAPVPEPPKAESPQEALDGVEG